MFCCEQIDDWMHALKRTEKITQEVQIKSQILREGAALKVSSSILVKFR